MKDTENTGAVLAHIERILRASSGAGDGADFTYRVSRVRADAWRATAELRHGGAKVPNGRAAVEHVTDAGKPDHGKLLEELLECARDGAKKRAEALLAAARGA